MKQLCLSLFAFCLPLLAFAQQGVIQGTVEAAEGPVPFASVGLIGTAHGTTADANGAFVMTHVPAGDYRIKANVVGSGSTEAAVTVKAGEKTLVRLELSKTSSRLREVVVTGTMREGYLSESPVPVEIYTPKYFQKNPTPSLFEALEIVNGVQPQVNCSVCGTGDIHINGMEGAYTMVLIDGMPMMSALATVYGLSGIPNSLVERVEVVKGPASTLYGSEAVAGLINIITKNPLKAPLVTADVFYSSHQELNTSVGVSKRFRGASTVLSADYFHFQDRRDVNADNFTDIPLQHRVSLFNKWSINRLGNKLASLAARYYYEDRFGGELQWAPAFRGGDSIYGESVFTRRYELQGAYQLPGTQNLALHYSFNDHLQNAAYGSSIYKGQQRVLFGQLVWDKALGPKHNLLMGSAYRYTYYDDNTPATAGTAVEASANNPIHTSLPGLFVQDEFKPSSSFSLLMGLRYDINSDHGSILTPRLNVKWSPTQENIWRLSLGKGYRVVNLFTEDHAALTGARKVVVLQELKPEQSYNASLHYQRYMNLGSGWLELQGTAFYTYFTNKIVADYLTDNNLILYDNLAGYAVSRGVALDAEAMFDFPLRLNAGLTLLDVFQMRKSSRLPQLHAPAVSATFAATYEVKAAGLTIDYTGSLKGPMHLPVQANDFRQERSPWFSLQNLQLTKRLHKGLEVYGGVKNIFNFLPKHPLMRPFDPFDKQVEQNNPNGYSFDTAYNYAPLQGRRVFFGLRYTLPGNTE